MSVYGERIARVEERVKELDDRMARVEEKLDKLLELRWKGAGAFWLASILFGTGVVGSLLAALNWIRSW